MTFNSIGYGSDEFVSVNKIGLGGDFFSVAESQNGIIIKRDEGRDVKAIINGALAVGNGLDVTLNTPTLSLKLELTAEYSQVTSVAKTFVITGGGANFQLGPDIPLKGTEPTSKDR